MWNDTEYFKTTKKWFRKKCERKQIVDPEITELRKSIPLYKDLSQSNTLVRQKYRGEGVNNAVVDFKSLAMSMICDGSRDSCITLAEMTLVRSSIGRGGEHIFLRYKEAAFDEYFQALDLDWPILKQTDRKCILIFCDRELYCCCVYFALGVFFLQGGLRREGVDPAISDHVFPHLHSIRTDGVATKLNNAMQKHIASMYDKSVAKQTTTRSIRKGAMTENRACQDLSTQEEYAISGHTPPEQNSNAEGYIESTPAMSAPGGRALAGYSDCHSPCVLFSFDCLGVALVPEWMRLIKHMFVIDVPELQYCASLDDRNRDDDKGKLWRVTVTAAARLIGSYNTLTQDLREKGINLDNHPIVHLIRRASRDAKIDDPNVPIVVGLPRWQVVLKDWYKRMNNDFEKMNHRSASPTASISSHLLVHGQQIDRVSESHNELLRRMDEWERVQETSLASTLDANTTMAQNLQSSFKERERYKKDNAQLRRQVAALQQQLLQQSMYSPTSSLAPSPAKAHEFEFAASAITVASALTTEKVDVADDEPPSKKPKSNNDNFKAVPSLPALHSSTATEATSQSQPSASNPTSQSQTSAPHHSSWSFLDGVPDILPKTTKGITVVTELERLWDGGVFRTKSAAALSDGTTLQRWVLFDDKHCHYFGCNPVFEHLSDKARYTRAMQLVAIAITRYS